MTIGINHKRGLLKTGRGYSIVSFNVQTNRYMHNFLAGISCCQTGEKMKIFGFSPVKIPGIEEFY